MAEVMNAKDIANEQNSTFLSRRVRLYLTGLGINDEAIQDRVARGMLDAMGDAGDQDVDGRVLQELMREYKHWLLSLDEQGGHSARPLIGMKQWMLQRELARMPEYLFRTEGFPDSFRQALARAQIPVVPPEQPGKMVVRPLGPAPAVLRPSFWNKMKNRIKRRLKSRRLLGVFK